MGLELALLVFGLLLFAAIAFFSLRGRGEQTSPGPLGAEPTLETGALPVETREPEVVTRRNPPVSDGEPVAEESLSEPKLPSAASQVEEEQTVSSVPEPRAKPKDAVRRSAGKAQVKKDAAAKKPETESPPRQKPARKKTESKAAEKPSAGASPAVKKPAPVEAAGEAVMVPGSAVDPATDGSELEMDFVARIKIGRPVIRDEILGIYRQHEYQFEKPSRIFGRNELTGLWCDIELELNSATFSQVGASIQLADKNGAITEDELNRFSQMVLNLADSLNRPFRFSMEFEEALERAQHLDQLGQRYDAMAVLNIVARQRQGFRATDLESCARDLSMYKNHNGVYIRADTRGGSSSRALYRMAPADEKGQLVGERATDANVRDLVLYMNVPATRDPEQVFHRMMEDARSLAEWLDGKIIDQHGRHMTARGFKQITRQIRDISQDMKKDGLRPGDAVASRLF